MTEMNESNEEANVPREPWKRLLEDGDSGPPETTDARIRAAARRDLAPRGQRWWLPASLAASFVLAVLVVRSELGTGGRAPMPAQRGGDSAIDARIIDRNEGEQAREPGKSPAAPARQKSNQRETAESDVYGYADSELGQEAAGTGPRVGGPERELRSASEMPDEAVATAEPSSARTDLPEATAPAAAPATQAEKDLGEVAVTGSRKRSSAMDEPAKESAWTPTHVAAPGGLVRSPAPEETPEETPEAWYDRIVALRKAGRTAEADAELARFEAAYPRWLKQHDRSPP